MSGAADMAYTDVLDAINAGDIDTAIARAMVGYWHGGQASAAYSYSSTGHIGDDLAHELELCTAQAETEEEREALWLVIHHIARG